MWEQCVPQGCQRFLISQGGIPLIISYLYWYFAWNSVFHRYFGKILEDQYSQEFALATLYFYQYWNPPNGTTSSRTSSMARKLSRGKLSASWSRSGPNYWNVQKLHLCPEFLILDKFGKTGISTIVCLSSVVLLENGKHLEIICLTHTKMGGLLLTPSLSR